MNCRQSRRNWNSLARLPAFFCLAHFFTNTWEVRNPKVERRLQSLTSLVLARSVPPHPSPLPREREHHRQHSKTARGPHVFGNTWEVRNLRDDCKSRI